MTLPARFVSRSAWGATARGATPASHPIGSTLGITAHWEGPGMGGFPHRLCARKVQTIQRFHKYTRGWADIAYNAVVCPHGYVFEGRGPNVKSAANGWEQVNDDWYAVCYLGGTGDPFTDAGRDGFRQAFEWLATEGNAGPKRNGHRDHKATTCPGDAIYAWVHSPDVNATPNREDWFDMATEQELRAIVREEVERGVDGILDTDINVQEPKGSPAFRGETLRSLLKELGRLARKGAVQ